MMMSDEDRYSRPARAEPLDTWRCPVCHRILAKLTLGPGSTVEVKCSCNHTDTRSEPIPPRWRTYRRPQDTSPHA
jgi:hypothetical protein